MINTLLLIYALLQPHEVVPANIWTVHGDTSLAEGIEYKHFNAEKREWFLRNLKSGDIIVSTGDTFLFNVLNFSQFVRELTASNYTHSGIITKVAGDFYVFDVASAGVQKIPLSVYLSEAQPHNVKILRLRDEYKDVVPMALAYCWGQYINYTPFDYKFKLGNDALYCSELVSNAFIAGRLLLKEPVKAGDLPGVTGHPLKTLFVMIAGSFTPEQKIYTTEGITTSKYLWVLYEGKL